MYGKDPLNNDCLLPAIDTTNEDEATQKLIQYIQSCIEGTALVEPEEGLQATVSFTDVVQQNCTIETPANHDSDSNLASANSVNEISEQIAGASISDSAASSTDTEEVPADLVNLFDSYYWYKLDSTNCIGVLIVSMQELERFEDCPVVRVVPAAMGSEIAAGSWPQYY